MSERTYKDPGDCIKCGSEEVDILFEADLVSFATGEESGTMKALCQRCGHRWPIKAKDEVKL